MVAIVVAAFLTFSPVASSLRRHRGAEQGCLPAPRSSSYDEGALAPPHGRKRLGQDFHLQAWPVSPGRYSRLRDRTRGLVSDQGLTLAPGAVERANLTGRRQELGRTLDKETPAMEYLVTMTTHVPAGTSEETVQATRDKEAARSRQLAAQGHLLRLWRPPLQPGEWRSLGLFAAQDRTELEAVLKSMPLRVWRMDEVTPLLPHPNDPATGGTSPRQDAELSSAPTNGGTKEFLTTFNIDIPDGTPRQSVDDTEASEAKAADELAQQGHLIRLWTLASQDGHGRALGLWRSQDEAGMKAILDGLPLSGWMTVDITPLTPHPSDPALASNHGRD